MNSGKQEDSSFMALFGIILPPTQKEISLRELEVIIR